MEAVGRIWRLSGGYVGCREDMEAVGRIWRL